MVPSSQMDFSLQPLLEQLNQDELSKFKSLLRTLFPKDELQHIPQTEVEEADGKQLAEILTKCCTSYWVEMVTIQIFDKMNRRDLSKRVKDELSEAALKPLQEKKPPSLGITQTQEHKCACLEEIQQHLEELTQVQEEAITNPEESKEVLEGEKPGKQHKYRSILKKIFWQIWKQNFLPGAKDDVHIVTQRYERLIPFYNPTMLAAPFPYTVVLHGPAGVGKTTLAKKVMLDWTQDNLPETRSSALYLSCKELNHKEACTFAELMSKNWPDLQEAGPEILAQAQKVLIIIDGFDELRAPSGSLIHDNCGDWKKQKPVSVLLGSLLKRKMLPKTNLLITTRPGALRELRPLLEQLLLVEIEGLSELDRREYFLRYFQEEHQALRAFDLMKSNPALFHMGSAPAVCWIVCTCLKLQMEKREDPAPTCQTTTSLFLRFLCCQFTQAPGSCPSHCLTAPVKALCVLAAESLWTQASVFNGEDLGRLGVEEPDLRPFLDKNIIQKDRDCGGCYSFIHLSVQQLLAAMFYVLKSEGEEDGESHRWDIGDIQKLLSKEERLKNPNLTHVVYFLFSLMNEKRARELETTFSCQVSMGIKQELLKLKSGGNKPLSSMMDMKEVVYCLYESQEEQLVRDAMVQVKEMSLHLKTQMDIVYSSFCLKHCQNLQKISLQVEKELFLENDTVSESDTWVQRSQDDQHMLPFWMDLCSVFGSNKNLIVLNISQSFLSTSSVRILSENIVSATCHLQKVILKNIAPADAYRNLCIIFGRHETLTHLTLQGNDQNDMLPPLCEVLRHPKCNLQYLRLYYCNITSDGCINLSMLLQQNSSLTHLDLGLNHLGITGLKFLCEALKKPLCNLRCLWLWGCAITPFSCMDLSSALSCNQNLVNLDLGQNSLGYSGVKMLCDALKLQNCPLLTLRLKIDKPDAQIQKLLKEIKERNPHLKIERDNQDPKNKRPSSHDFIF